VQAWWQKIFLLGLLVGGALPMPDLCGEPAPASKRLLTDDGDDDASLSDAELTEPQGRTTIAPPTAVPRAAPLAAAPVNSRTAACLQLVKNYSGRVRELYSRHQPTLRLVPTPELTLILGADESRCLDPERREEYIATAIKFMGEHTGKIGVVLPLSGTAKDLGDNILKGMTALLKQRGKQPYDYILVRDSRGDAAVAEMHMAELYLRHRVATVIGGVHAQDAKTLAWWGDRLRLPTILLSNHQRDNQRSRHVFHVFPNEDAIAEALANHCGYRQFKNVAILQPLNSETGALVSKLTQALQKKNILANRRATYKLGDYESMEQAARQLLHVEKGARASEYTLLLHKLRSEAKQQGKPFNPDMVELPPIIDFDAVFIPDNFKNVRHFVQMLKYLGVKQLPLLGSHQWRSPGLVTPYDPFLEGAFFADFVGSYYDLPKGIPVRTLGSPFFVNVTDARNYDFNLIGFHSLELALGALVQQPIRYKMAKTLAALPLDASGYFGRGLAFMPDKASRWPAFVFQVRDEKITLVPTAL